MRLSEEEFAALVHEALRDVPEHLAPYMDDIVVDVEPMPDEETLREVESEDPSEILGVYHGTPLTERSFEADLTLPDRITIFQRNIEEMCETRTEIIEEIRTTVFHEVGHHFGLDEDDLEELGFG